MRARLAWTLAAFLLGCRVKDMPPEIRGSDRGPALSASLATLPPSFVETTLGTVSLATAMAVAPDGRLFVCEQTGRVRVVKNGALLADAFLTLPVSSNGERGLLGIAFDPDFAATRHVFVYYTTASSPVHNRISRFSASSSNPDLAEAGSELPLMELPELGASNHNGGALAFGQDGKLYVAVGDNAVETTAQNMSTPLGKMLRLNKDGSIPSDNPFFGSATGNNRAIWALGLRNPFTFAFQPGTGKLFINDVGLDSWEEINEGAAGANFGWPATEGHTTNPAYRTPFYTYANGTGPDGDCAIVGAAFYNPASPSFPPEYSGAYFFGDYCGDWMKRIDPATKTVSDFATGFDGLTGIAVAPDGSLYYCEANSGKVRRITYTGSLAPVFSQHPVGLTVSEGATAAFSAAANGGQPLAYRWQRDGVDIPGATAATYSLAAQLSDSGAVFRCIVSNAQGQATSDPALLRVTRNRPPVASITGPDGAWLYRGGDTLSFSGTGTDPEDGTLPASAFTWKVDFHHESHLHPLMAPVSGSRTGKLAIPSEGEHSSTVWLRLHLTVTDKEGLAHAVTRDIQPRKATLTLATDPPNLTLNLDGFPVTAPHVFTGVSGVLRTIQAQGQPAGGRSYEFVSWSDGGAASHAITTPDADRTYTATFREILPNAAPTASIVSPGPAATYRAGTALAYGGAGTDPEDGDLPDSAFTWRIDLHHDTHTHPALPLTSGAKAGSYLIPSEGETSPNVFYRVHLTVRDRSGVTHSVTRDVQPQKAQVTLATVPGGLRLQLDGADVTAPHAFSGVAGVRRTVGAASQALDGKVFELVSWSDGGAPSHAITSPDTDRTFTATFRETAVNQPPTASILTPAAGSTYQGGAALAWSASGTDPEDGLLPDSAFTWRVEFHHVDHVHPVLPATKGARTGTVTVPSEGETSADVFYRIHLTVTDKAGLTHSEWRDVTPVKVQVTLATEPAGLKLQLDGTTVTAPFTFTGVAGMRRGLNAFLGQELGGTAYEFQSWSDSGAARHSLVTPASASTITARYRTAVSTGIRRPK